MSKFEKKLEKINKLAKQTSLLVVSADADP